MKEDVSSLEQRIMEVDQALRYLPQEVIDEIADREARQHQRTNQYM